MTLKHFLLFYDYSPDYLVRRGEFRSAHIQSAQGAIAGGQLLVAGPLANPADAGVYLWKCEDEAPIRAFVENDPYFKNGLVTAWRIREWTTVAGPLALNPVTP